MSAPLPLFLLRPAPALLTLLLMLLLPALLPYGLKMLVPPVLLLSVFFWSVFRPASLPFYVIVPLGLVSDVLFGLNLGMMPCLAMTGYALCRMQGRNWSRLGFGGIWLQFCFWIGGLLLMLWAVMSLLGEQLLPFVPLVTQALASMLLYPLLHGMFFRLWEQLPRLDD